jgi:transcriptional regulator with XRE-family HTH domain
MFDFNKELCQFVRKIRQEAGMTQKEFASALGTSQSYVSALESGYCKISLKYLEKTLAHFGYSLHVEIKPNEQNNV